MSTDREMNDLVRPYAERLSGIAAEMKRRGIITHFVVALMVDEHDVGVLSCCEPAEEIVLHPRFMFEKELDAELLAVYARPTVREDGVMEGVRRWLTRQH